MALAVPLFLKSSNGQRLRLIYDDLNRVSLSKWSLNNMAYSTGYIYGDTAAHNRTVPLCFYPCYGICTTKKDSR